MTKAEQPFSTSLYWYFNLVETEFLHNFMGQSNGMATDSGKDTMVVKIDKHDWICWAEQNHQSPQRSSTYILCFLTSLFKISFLYLISVQVHALKSIDFMTNSEVGP